MDAEERRSLEAELAAELAGLSDVVDDDGDELEAVHHGDNARETTSSPGISGGESAFVRLDLDRLLRQLASSDQDAHKQRTQQSSGVRGDGDGETMSSWGLLLASVQTSDAEFFQFIRQDLHDIQTTILTSPTDSNATSSPASKADLAQCEANSTQKSGYGDPAASALASPLTISEIGSPAIENGVGNDKSEQIQASDELSQKTGSANDENYQSQAKAPYQFHLLFNLNLSSCQSETKNRSFSSTKQGRISCSSSKSST
ncbi:hypothetical protein Gpo141_00008619 [Globisporangium polare]